MNQTIRKWLTSVSTLLRFGLKRFPEAIVMAILTALSLIVLNHEMYESIPEKLALIFGLGFAAFLVKSVVLERFKDRPWSRSVSTHLIIIISVILLLTGYYFLLPDELGNEDSARYAVIFASLILAFLATPYAFRREHFEKYITTVVFRLAITYLFAYILLLGLLAIIGTIDLLFDTMLIDLILFDIAIVIQIVFAPIFFLAYLPKYEEDMGSMEYVSFFRIFINGIILPILAAYTIVLIVYFLSILFVLEWPRGVVSTQVLALALVSTLILFVIRPIRDSNRWLGFFVRWFPPIMLPMLIMMYVSVFIRINEYGVTESRYMVVAIGIWVTIVMLYWTVDRYVRNIWLPLTLMIFLLVTVISPFNVFATSVDSQNNRLEEILNRYQMIVSGKLIRQTATNKKTMTKKDREEVIAIFDYFQQNHTLKEIRVLPSSFKAKQANDYLGFEINVWDYDEVPTKQSINIKVFNYYAGEPLFTNISEYDYIAEFNDYEVNSEQIHEAEGIRISYNKNKQVISISKDNQIIQTIDVQALVMQIYDKYKQSTNVTAQQLTVIEENERVKSKIQFQTINGEVGATLKDLKISYSDLTLLIDLK
jgi:low temperature requirement protein LtrA